MALRKFLTALIFSLIVSVNVCSADEVLAVAETPDDWALTLVKTDGGAYLFYIIEEDTNKQAFVPYDRKVYDFYLHRDSDGIFSPLIFNLFTTQGPTDVDDEFGEWENRMHILPVYALFEYDGEKVFLESYLSSGEGLHPLHYQGRLQSPFHIKLAETFVTQMPALHKIIDSQGIILP